MIKRIVAFFILITTVFSLGAGDIGKQEFSIMFKKPGVTDYHFTEEGTTTLSRFQYFTPYFGSSEPTASFGFDWSVYHDGYVSISLVFAADNEAADIAYGNPDAEDSKGYMLEHATFKTERGINYTVKPKNQKGDGISCTESKGSDSSEAILGADRTIKILNRKATSTIEGTSGHVDFDLKIAASNFTVSENAAMSGQYSGIVRCYVVYDS